MAFLDIFKKQKNDKISPLPENNKAVDDTEEEWGDLLPALKPLSLSLFDSIETARLCEDEKFAKKHNLRVNPLQGYDVL